MQLILSAISQTIALGKEAFNAPDEPLPDTVPDESVKAALAHRKAK